MKTTSGNAAPPQKAFGTSVYFPIVMSKWGTSRSAPISQPRYQSGCAPFVAEATWYGPQSRSG